MREKYVQNQHKLNKAKATFSLIFFLKLVSRILEFEKWTKIGGHRQQNFILDNIFWFDSFSSLDTIKFFAFRKRYHIYDVKSPTQKQFTVLFFQQFQFYNKRSLKSGQNMGSWWLEVLYLHGWCQVPVIFLTFLFTLWS